MVSLSTVFAQLLCLSNKYRGIGSSEAKQNSEPSVVWCCPRRYAKGSGIDQHYLKWMGRNHEQMAESRQDNQQLQCGTKARGGNRKPIESSKVTRQRQWVQHGSTAKLQYKTGFNIYAKRRTRTVIAIMWARTGHTGRLRWQNAFKTNGTVRKGDPGWLSNDDDEWWWRKFKSKNWSKPPQTGQKNFCTETGNPWNERKIYQTFAKEKGASGRKHKSRKIHKTYNPTPFTAKRKNTSKGSDLNT